MCIECNKSCTSLYFGIFCYLQMHIPHLVAFFHNKIFRKRLICKAFLLCLLVCFTQGSAGLFWRIILLSEGLVCIRCFQEFLYKKNYSTFVQSNFLMCKILFLRFFKISLDFHPVFLCDACVGNTVFNRSSNYQRKCYSDLSSRVNSYQMLFSVFFILFPPTSREFLVSWFFGLVSVVPYMILSLVTTFYPPDLFHVVPRFFH
jgi:hypothetical protein